MYNIINLICKRGYEAAFRFGETFLKLIGILALTGVYVWFGDIYCIFFIASEILFVLFILRTFIPLVTFFIYRLLNDANLVDYLPFERDEDD